MAGYIISLLLRASLAVTALGPGEAARLPVSGPWGYSAVFIRNDTVTVITHGNIVYLFKLVGDSVVENTRLGIGGLSEFDRLEFVSTPNSIACLYEGINHLNLYELADNGNEGNLNTKIPINNTYDYYLIPCDSSLLAVFEDYDKPFTLNSHSGTMEYGPLAYIKLGSGVPSRPKHIESGRVSSSWFQYAVVHDTVYALWKQTKHESFMSWVMNVKSNLVSAKYGGTSWSEPQSILDVTKQEIQIHGLYELNDQLYCFFSTEATEGNHDNIYYMKSIDHEHWTSPVELSSCQGSLNRWLACSDGRGTLHLVILDSKKQDYVYYTFDGNSLEYRYDLELGDFRKVDVSLISIASDKGQAYLFYSKSGRIEEDPDNPYEIRGTYVSPEGDTYRTELANPNYKKQEPRIADLFMLEL
jgi:hypothetical protein